MADRTAIQWTDATWNPIRGCTRVSAGCQHCYAERMAARFSGPGQPYEGLIHPATKGWNGKVRLVPEALAQPWHWVKPRRIFVNSMSDLFHPAVPFEFIAAVFWVMSVTTRHTYQVLTKRPERALEFFRWAADEDTDGPDDRIYNIDEDVPAIKALREAWRPATATRGGYDNCGPGWPYTNVWLGVSVEDQATADERIPLLLQCPAAVRWLSCEPLLGPVDLEYACSLANIDAGKTWGTSANAMRMAMAIRYGEASRLDWVVTGGESGPGARPMHPDWARSLRDQCAAAGVPFFFKQWGDWEIASLENGHHGSLMPDTGERYTWLGIDGRTANPSGLGLTDAYAMARVGKKRAGRLLDGIEHNAYPDDADV